MDTKGVYAFQVRSYECGPDGLATLATICNYLQETASLHAEALGFSKSDFAAEGANISWVLTRLRVTMTRYPRWEEKVVVTTYPRGGRRITAHRDFILRVGEETVGVATSEWMVIDLATRKVVAVPPRVYELANDVQPPVMGEEAFSKLRWDCREASGAVRFRARRGDIDLNGHVNNVHYVEWLVEAVPATAGAIRDFEIAFKSETLAGDEVLSEAVEVEPHVWAAHVASPEGKDHVVSKLKALLMAGLLAMGAGTVQAAWLYPQMDCELYRIVQMQDDARRMGLYAAHPGKLPALRSEAEFRIRCPQDKPAPFASDRLTSSRYDEKEGRLYVTVHGSYFGGGAIRSSRTDWEAKVFDGSWRPAAAYPDAPVAPHRITIPVGGASLTAVRTNGWYDLGRESLAYVECLSDERPVLRAGESLPEMLEDDGAQLEYDPTLMSVGENRWRSVHPLAMRYFRLKGAVSGVRAVPVCWPRPEPAAFASPNARWNRMRAVGVRTLELCANEFLIDGIKRDRLPWGGDLTVSMLADAYVWGDASVARASLSAMDAYLGDVNGAVTYSMWTVVSHDLYQLYFGDGAFLRDRWWRVKWRVEDLIARTDPETGFVVRDVEWAFVDWAEPQSETAMHAIWYGALGAAARLADRVRDPRAADYRALAAKVRAALDRTAWDETRGLYRANPDGKDVFGRQANVFAVIFGAAEGAKATRIGDALAGRELPPVGTPYVFGWELIALNRTGHRPAFFDGLERIFGGMLDAGATTFWEGYDAAATGDEHYKFYGRKWGKSLCHVWSAWPAFLFVSEVMGVKPTSDGWATYEAKPMPEAAGCTATVPTPRGRLKF